MTEIKIAESDEEIESCYDVVSELRPHIAREDFAPQVRRQMAASGFRLVYLTDAGDVKAVGGIRVAEWLARGRSLDIEDLVATETDRSKGYGGKLFDWIVSYAKENDCREIRLVSHVTRYRAHRFYLNKGMIIDAHFFSMPL
jgi:GNAT superfamily N-acetyltransferase